VDTAIKHPVSDRVKPVICNFSHPDTLTLNLSIRVHGCQKLQMTGLTHSGKAQQVL